MQDVSGAPFTEGFLAACNISMYAAGGEVNRPSLPPADLERACALAAKRGTRGKGRPLTCRGPRAGQSGSTVPFPRTEMRDYQDPRMEGLNDPRRSVPAPHARAGCSTRLARSRGAALSREHGHSQRLGGLCARAPR